jgi:hypothetical protein
MRSPYPTEANHAGGDLVGCDLPVVRDRASAPSAGVGALPRGRFCDGGLPIFLVNKHAPDGTWPVRAHLMGNYRMN